MNMHLLLTPFTHHPGKAVFTGHTYLFRSSRRRKRKTLAQASLSPCGCNRFFNGKEQSAAEKYRRLPDPLKNKQTKKIILLYSVFQQIKYSTVHKYPILFRMSNY